MLGGVGHEMQLLRRELTRRFKSRLTLPGGTPRGGAGAAGPPLAAVA